MQRDNEKNSLQDNRLHDIVGGKKGTGRFEKAWNENSSKEINNIQWT